MVVVNCEVEVANMRHPPRLPLERTPGDGLPVQLADDAVVGLRAVEQPATSEGFRGERKPQRSCPHAGEVHDGGQQRDVLGPRRAEDDDGRAASGPSARHSAASRARRWRSQKSVSEQAYIRPPRSSVTISSR